MPALSLTTFRVELDDETVASLLTVAAICGKEPRVIAAELLTSILTEDAVEHALPTGQRLAS